MTEAVRLGSHSIIVIKRDECELAWGAAASPARK
jgi:hypothetical protein